MERYGARITLCDNNLDARRSVLAEVIDRTAAVEVHPFDDERVIAGAGTAALELLADVPDLDVDSSLRRGQCVTSARRVGGRRGELRLQATQALVEWLASLHRTELLVFDRPLMTAYLLDIGLQRLELAR